MILTANSAWLNRHSHVNTLNNILIQTKKKAVELDTFSMENRGKSLLLVQCEKINKTESKQKCLELILKYLKI